MSREDILAALRDVGARLLGRGLQGDLYVVGGAAIALVYDLRRMTRDVDAAFEPKMEIYEAARLVAQERGLTPGWLNDAVKGTLAGPDPHEAPVLELPGLRCMVASPQMLLALKVLAHRPDSDAEDLRLLIGMLDLGTPDEVLDLAARLLAPRRLPVESQYFVDEVMSG